MQRGELGLGPDGVHRLACREPPHIVAPRRATMRPGRGDITSTVVPSRSASSMEWVMKKICFLVLAQTTIRSSCICTRVRLTSAPKCSSMSSTLGSAARARAKPTRWRMPPESSCG